jgi:hypothetical protein
MISTLLHRLAEVARFFAPQVSSQNVASPALLPIRAKESNNKKLESPQQPRIMNDVIVFVKLVTILTDMIVKTIPQSTVHTLSVYSLSIFINNLQHYFVAHACPSEQAGRPNVTINWKLL